MFCEGVVASIVCMSSTSSQNGSAGASLADSSATAMSATMPAVSAPAASVQLGRVRAAFTRRNFLKVGLGGAAVLAVLRVAHGPYLPVVTPAVAAGVQAHKLAVLSAHEAAVLAAIAPVMLGWAAVASPATANDIDERSARVVAGVDRAVAGLPLPVQAEVHDLFNLLGLAPARWLATGLRKPWHEASAEDISTFLARWRFSRIGLLQAGYHALHELIAAAWYGDLDNWKVAGYAPPRFG
jgi:hypothetical protein